MENLRFHKEETEYDKGLINQSNNNIVNLYSKLGDVYICDAFGCVHRNHMSICGIKNFNKEIGYGHLIKKEIDSLKTLIDPTKKILCVIGGNKIEDKIPIIDSFKNLPNATIFIAGGLAKHYNPTLSNTIVMEDGWGNENINLEPRYITDIKNTNFNCYDIGPKSKMKLFNLTLNADIVFWNGSLGVIENDFYRLSSIEYIKYLESINTTKTIIGGGETGSLVSNKNSNIYVSTGGGALLEYIDQQLNFGTNIVGLEIYQ